LRYVLNKEEVKIGLLNIGEEETKGTALIKETHRLLDMSALNFIGNIEGRDIFTGKCDVIVCDGFSGNIILKVSESIAETLGKLFNREINKGLLTKIGGFLSMTALHNFKKKIDYTEIGGAPLLGIDGVCIISHGRSTAKAIKNAIKVAGELKPSIGIIGLGAYLPKKILTNFDLEKMVDTSDEWITTRTGIKERRIAAKNEPTSELAARAGAEAIKNAGLSAKNVDLIRCCKCGCL
jgi:hypothetical protein